MARKIVFTSGKGGVGKTTSVASVGLKLAHIGARVALMDIDIGLNNLDVVLNIDNRVKYDIFDVIEGRCRLKQALVQDEREPLLYILPSNHIYTSTLISSFSIKNVVDELGEYFDYILIDSPAGIDKGFHRAVSCADEAIVVTTPHYSAIRDADKVLNLLNSYDLSNIFLLVNKVRGDLMLKGDMIEVDEICSLLHTNLLGVVPEDDSKTLSKMDDSLSDSDKAYKMVAENLFYGQNNIYDYKHKYQGFLGRIKRTLRGKV